MMGTDKLESSFAEKGLGILVDKLNVNQQCVLAALAANILDCIRKSIAGRLREAVFTLCLALVKPYLGCQV